MAYPVQIANSIPHDSASPAQNLEVVVSHTARFVPTDVPTPGYLAMAQAQLRMPHSLGASHNRKAATYPLNRKHAPLIILVFHLKLVHCRPETGASFPAFLN